MLRKLKLTSLAVAHRHVDHVILPFEIPILHRLVEQHGLYVFQAVFAHVVASVLAGLMGWIILESQGKHKM